MKWQYKIEVDLNEEYELNKLGKKGWELIIVVSDMWENERKGSVENTKIYYFKRKL